jgi:hypothetical protein
MGGWWHKKRSASRSKQPAATARSSSFGRTFRMRLPALEGMLGKLERPAAFDAALEAVIGSEPVEVSKRARDISACSGEAGYMS